MNTKILHIFLKKYLSKDGLILNIPLPIFREWVWPILFIEGYRYARHNQFLSPNRDRYMLEINGDTVEANPYILQHFESE